MSKNCRQEIISTLYEKTPLFKGDYAKGFEDAISVVINTVQELMPMGDLESVKHAHWIVGKYEGVVMCSNPDCFAVFSDNSESIGYDWEDWDFCPKCGAKMDEKVNTDVKN